MVRAPKPLSTRVYVPSSYGAGTGRTLVDAFWGLLWGWWCSGGMCLGPRVSFRKCVDGGHMGCSFRVFLDFLACLRGVFVARHLLLLIDVSTRVPTLNASITVPTLVDCDRGLSALEEGRLAA